MAGLDFLWRNTDTDRAMCELLPMRRELYWLAQDVRDASKVEHLLSQYTGEEWGWPKRENEYATNGKNIGAGLLKPIQIQLVLPCIPDADTELQDSLFALLVIISIHCFLIFSC